MTELHPEETVVELPGGILDKSGERHTRIVVRQLTGADEEMLADRRFRNGAHQVSEFLVRAVVRIEGWSRPVDSDLSRDMLIGDRDFLLLRLRQMALGDKIEQVLRCPNSQCGKKVEVEFLISEIAVRRAETLQSEYELTLSAPVWANDPESNRLSLRLPTGGDQEAILELQDNPAAVNTRLFSRIVKRVGRNGGLDELAARALPLRVRRQLVDFLREVSPGPDLRIEIQCPHCMGDMSYPFDLSSFFLRSG